MKMDYVLMNKDREIAIINCDGNTLLLKEILDRKSWLRLNSIIGSDLESWFYQIRF